MASFSVFLLVFHFFAFAIPASSQDRYFNVISFTVDGRPVKDYKVQFEVGGNVITPQRRGNRIFVSDQISKAEGVLISIQSENFTFKQHLNPGYLESDDIKVDFKLEIDTPPFEPENRALKPFTNYCAVFSIIGVPRTLPGADKFVDPMIGKTVQHCP